MNYLRIWVHSFVQWYDKHERTATIITAILFSTQLLHLYWLATNVIAERLFGTVFFDPNEFWQNLIIIFDYFEIPALMSATILYGRRLHKKREWKSVRNLIFVNIQYLHIFWITDEFVESVVTNAPQATILPAWLAITAIIIDYLELPVIIETIRDTWKIVSKKSKQRETND